MSDNSPKITVSPPYVYEVERYRRPFVVYDGPTDHLKCGDTITLVENFTGRQAEKVLAAIEYGHEYSGIKEGFCVLGLADTPVQMIERFRKMIKQIISYRSCERIKERTKTFVEKQGQSYERFLTTLDKPDYICANFFARITNDVVASFSDYNCNLPENEAILKKTDELFNERKSDIFHALSLEIKEDARPIKREELTVFSVSLLTKDQYLIYKDIIPLQGSVGWLKGTAHRQRTRNGAEYVFSPCVTEEGSVGEEAGGAALGYRPVLRYKSSVELSPGEHIRVPTDCSSNVVCDDTVYESYLWDSYTVLSESLLLKDEQLSPMLGKQFGSRPNGRFADSVLAAKKVDFEDSWARFAIEWWFNNEWDFPQHPEMYAKDNTGAAITQPRRRALLF